MLPPPVSVLKLQLETLVEVAVVKVLVRVLVPTQEFLQFEEPSCPPRLARGQALRSPALAVTPSPAPGGTNVPQG